MKDRVTSGWLRREGIYLCAAILVFSACSTQAVREPVISSAEGIAACEKNGRLLEAGPVPDGYALDGFVEEWAGRPAVVIADAANVASGNWRGPADASARVWAAWMPEALILAVSARDDQTVSPAKDAAPSKEAPSQSNSESPRDAEGSRKTDSSGGDAKSGGGEAHDDSESQPGVLPSDALAGDGIRFHFAGTDAGSRREGRYTLAFAVTATGRVTTLAYGEKFYMRQTLDRILTRSARTPGLYSLEIEIPRKLLKGIALEQGNRCDAQFCLIDRDTEPAIKSSVLVWPAGATRNYRTDVGHSGALYLAGGFMLFPELLSAPAFPGPPVSVALRPVVFAASGEPPVARGLATLALESKTVTQTPFVWTGPQDSIVEIPTAGLAGGRYSLQVGVNIDRDHVFFSPGEVVMDESLFVPEMRKDWQGDARFDESEASDPVLVYSPVWKSPEDWRECLLNVQRKDWGRFNSIRFSIRPEYPGKTDETHLLLRLDDDGRSVHETEREIQSGEWTDVAWDISSVPRGGVTAFKLSTKGEWYTEHGTPVFRIRNMRLSPLESLDEVRELREEVAVNQVGFSPSDPKRFYYQTFVRPGTEPEFELIDGKDKVCFEGKTTPLGAIEEWETQGYAGDFTEFKAVGEYRIRVIADGHVVESAPFRIDARRLISATGEDAVKFFYIQRCGCEVPGWHPPCHMDDAKLPDGSHLDATGGWHDAGDYNKYNGFTPLSVYSLLAAYRAHKTFYDRFDSIGEKGRADVLDEAEWGMQWLVKMTDPATGLLRNSVFSGYGCKTAPELDTDNVIGNDDDRPVKPGNGGASAQYFAAAGFALASKLRESMSGHLPRAERMFAATDELGDRSPESVASRIIACVELWRATGKDSYAVEAEKSARELVALQFPAGHEWEGAFRPAPNAGQPGYSIVNEGLVPAAIALLANARPHAAIAPSLRDSLALHVKYLSKLTDNPARISKIFAGGRLHFFFPFEPEKWYVGQNSQYLSQAWAALLAHRATGKAEFRDFAQRHIDWILGANPLGVCMFEGAGSLNPPSYHHRYRNIAGQPRGAVPGCVPNGIVRFSPERDVPRFDFRENVMAAWQSNEPWLPHNAYYLLALSELPAE